MMMWLRRSVPVGCLLFALALAAPAAADGYDSAVARAAAARDRALETDSTQDWQEALELFGAAIEFNPTMEANFEYAEAAVRLKLDDDAFGAYENALALGIAGKAREKAQAFVDAHDHALGRLTLEGPAGARIYVDERKRGTLPLPKPIPLVPGAHRLHVDATSYRSFEREIEVTADETQSLTLRLEPVWIPPPDGLPPPPSKPATPPPVAERPSGAWITPVLVGGGVLAGAGVYTIVSTSVMLGKKRADLAEECAVVVDDACEATTAEHLSSAQSIGNDILALKGMRWAAIGATMVGAGAVGLALYGLAKSNDGEKPKHSARLELSGTFTGVRWQSEF